MAQTAHFRQKSQATLVPKRAPTGVLAGATADELTFKNHVGNQPCMGLAYVTEETTTKIAVVELCEFFPIFTENNVCVRFGALPSQIHAQFGSPAPN